ncbi:MAG: hypothetical protein IPO06_22685 [Leptospiraceae bacterium]|nr:hypothetical protein [Leptospiraceae bacterium]
MEQMDSFFKRLFVTYTKENEKTGEIYSGRASGIISEEDINGTSARDILAKRDSSHHKNKDGFQRADIDVYSVDSDATRGRKQMLIDYNGGAKSEGDFQEMTSMALAIKIKERAILGSCFKNLWWVRNFILAFTILYSII